MKPKALFVFLLLLVFPFCIHSQVIQWQDHPQKTFVYEISNKEAERLIKSEPKDSLILQMLHTPAGSFSGEWTDRPKQGHFIFADILQNQVGYRYAPVMPFQVFLFKEYGVLTLQVVDSEGKIRDDAKVRIKGRWRLFDTGVYFDKVSHTYTIDDDSEQANRLLTVELDKFTVMFNLSKHFVNPWYGGYNHYSDNGPDFYSYMITDKNKYKPGETVRFKSYALSERRRPLKEELEVWMSVPGKYYDDYKKITTISPYHPGGYAGEIVLHDSLKLRLDKHYSIQLREKKKRIVASCSFKYEDYELFDSRMETKLQLSSHYDPDTNRIEIKTLDANGLFLQDMKAEVLIKRGNVSAAYTDVLVLPDTLMYQKINLANDKPTIVDIPPSLFGMSNCSYTIYIKAYTYDNQILSSQQSATFYKSRQDLVLSTRNDSICFNFNVLGRDTKAKAQLWYDDDKEGKNIELPYEEPFNQAIKYYHIHVEDPAYSQSFGSAQINPRLNIAGGISADSFNVKLVNPLNLDLSWYIYQGNILLEKGFGKEFDFKYPNTNLEVTHYVELFYFLGDSERSYSRTFIPKTEFLDVDINLPERIYPGQTLDAVITVKDNMGRPVKDVDLTAWAFNSQLGYSVPDLPYYGSSPRSREQRNRYSINEKNYSFRTPLNYPYWNAVAHLDTMKYYQFTYPWAKIFRYAVDTPDSTTQFAPYIMKNGNAVKIYAIEANGTPLYFSWTEQPKTYSFLVPDSVEQQIALRLHDRVILLDGQCFEAKKKTIVSMDLDHLPEYVRVIMLNTKDKYGNYHFTGEEKKVYSNYVSRIPVADFSDFTYLKQQNTIYPVFHRCFQSRKSDVLIGPLRSGRMQYNNGVIYKHEGGFSYQYEDNVVYKYPLNPIPETIAFSSSNKFTDLNDFYLTAKVFNEAIERCKKAESARWFPSRIVIAQNAMNLNFILSMKQDTTGVSNLLFRNVQTKQLLFPDQIEYSERKYSQIPPATYDVILLYNSGNYVRFDSIAFQENTYLEVNMTKLPLIAKDSVSQKWLALRTQLIPPEKINYRTQTSIYYTPPKTIHRNAWNVVKGTVLSGDDNEPLIGASVILKGTNHGTITDMDGRFEIVIEEDNSLLLFSYIGFKTKEQQVMMGSEITITLEEDARMLDEVVTVGYGTVRQRMFTGSISSISSDTYVAPQSPPEKVEDDGDNEAEIKAAEDNLYAELLQLNGLRSNFSDVGFWEPRLYTDKKGKAQFTVTFPDNITQWNTVVYAMNRRLKTGTARKYIQSYKPLMAELKNPSFLVAGDSAYYAGNIRNYTRDKEIEGQISFAVGNDTLLNEMIRFQASHQDKMLVNPMLTDSITTTYLFRRNDGYTDGEERTVPVLPQGTEVAEGTLDFLRNGDRKTIAAGEGEEIHVTLTANPLDVYVDAANYLRSYKYDCNEQLASKLLGLLNFKIYQQYIGKPFKYDERINEIIKKLTENRNDQKLWSWFGNSSSTSYWMSAHVIRALNQAKQAGYQVDLDLTKAEQDYVDTKRYRSVSLYDIDILNALSEMGTQQNYEAALQRFDQQIEQLEFINDSIARKNKTKNTTSYLKEKLQLLEIRQGQKTGYSPELLTKYLKKDVLGAIYCDDGLERYWWGDNLMTTLIAYRIVRNDSTLASLKEPMQMYILKTKQLGWNTYQASSAMMTILPDLLTKSMNKDNLATVALSGKETRELNRFPYETILTAGEQLKIEKKQGMPLIYSAYKMKRVTTENQGDAFEISTELNRDSLQAGVPVTMYATVKVKQKNADHVMIEIPIPAGCSYTTKNNYYRYGYNREVYREYFKDRIAIFCESLPMGEYTYSIELSPRYTGKYILNPAKVEMMYFPVIESNNELRKVEIWEQK
ncbi:MAG: carboxypeptidase-like regulatory domain-containing protein [Dysgonamonadaceae bacterium]|nr:carboxypeptidase-like regulatory domain-containing protein [Dysgonamonadaceae bacterium]